MKIKYLLIGLLALGLFSPSIVAAASKYLETQHRQKQQKQKVVTELTCGRDKSPLRIGAYATNPPFSWTKIVPQGDQRFSYVSSGYNIDLMKEILNGLHVKYVVVGYNSDSKMWRDFQIGRLDAIIGTYYDPKMKIAGHSFLTPALIQNVVAIIFMKGKEKEVRSFDDLIGLKGVVRQDEHLYQYIRPALPTTLTIEGVSDSRKAFTKLLTGEADYMLGSPYAAEAEARRFKMNLDISMITAPLPGQELFVLYSRRSKCKKMAGKISRKLREKRQDIPAMKRDLITHIDKWGQRFKDDAPLAQQLTLLESDDTVVQTAEDVVDIVPDDTLPENADTPADEADDMAEDTSPADMSPEQSENVAEKPESTP